MAFIAALATVLCFNQVLSKDFPKPENCDVPDKAQIEGKLDQLFRNLPKEYLVDRFRTELYPGAIFLEASIVSRLDEFRPDRPYETFCRGNDTVTLFSIYSKYPIRMTIPWRLCSGQNGTIDTSVDRVRYEGELVMTKTQAGTQSKITNLMPVVMDSINVGMTGAGEAMHIIAQMLGDIVSRPFRALWTMVVTSTVQETLDKTLKTLN
uniref:Putative secreted protein n=1 Tax=Ixodes ricinus TaxID=34613 RepID=V5IDH8_IXORI